jgi:predicted O-methyltransferase YrrM
VAEHRVEDAHPQPRARDAPATFVKENAINAPTPATWAYAENFVIEDDVLARARARSEELGCRPVRPGTGAALSVLAAALSARSVVEVGTGTGVSGLYLLRGMPGDGVLTTIDVEVENQRAARETFTEAGIRPNRTRVISGRALDVLPRLTDKAYDLVLLDGEKSEYDAYLEQAIRLLRPGGLLAIDSALWHGKVADPAQRDAVTTGVRELGKRIRDDDRLMSAMLPCGDGLLVAVSR